ncbi:MAG: hypothetical protein ACK4TA_07645 [Saprospiraceae bacterium]
MQNVTNPTQQKINGMESQWNDEYYFIEAYKKAVAEHLNWGDSAHWRHSDFMDLSEKIFAQTGVMLSNTTLKRLWGKLKYDSLPTSHTLNVLAQFLGYENWLAFKTEMQEKAEPLPPIELEKPNFILKKAKKFVFPRMIAGFAGVAILVVICISFIFNEKPSTFTPAQLAKVKFSSQPIAEGVPNTVIFNYDLGDIQSTDIQIQQSWDSTKRFRITEITNEAASTYYRPGYWRAKLIVNGQIIKEHDVFIKSQGWLVTQDVEPKPRYFLPDELVKADYLGVDSAVLEATFSKSVEPQWLTYHYVEDFKNLYSDNFTFQAAVKNTYRRGDGVCQESRILILCENGFIGIPLAIPGCVGDLRLRIFDHVEEGNKRDLSAFGCDFSEWQRINVTVKNKLAKIFINDKLVREVHFTSDAGRVVGMRAGFRGAGIIDDVGFFAADGAVVYQNLFSKDNIK